MSISEKDLMKLAESMEEFSMSDYTIEELEILLNKKDNDFKSKYFEFYDDVKDKSLKKQDW